MRTGHTLGARAWAFSVWILVAFFVLNLAGMIATVMLDSIGTHWFRTWLPAGWTLRWYGMVWNEFQLPPILIVTVEVVAAVVFLSGLIGVPAAYAMARREFPGKRAALPHSRILIHQPATEGGYGQASDIEIQANEILRIREEMENILARHSGRDEEEVRRDIERDKFLTAAEAKEYGMIDEVLTVLKRGSERVSEVVSS